MHGSNSTAIHAPRSLGHLISNVPGPEHGPRLVFPIDWTKPTLDSVLAVAEDFAVASIHSKCPFCWLLLFLIERNSHQQ
jgi:hypothetical protein